MKCKDVIELAHDYLEDTLELNQSLQVEKHLDSCNKCKKEIAALQKSIELASSLPIEYPSMAVWNNFVPELLSKIEKSSEKSSFLANWQFLKGYRWKIAGAAISFVFILAIVFNNFLLISKPQKTPKTPKEVIAENLINNNLSIEKVDKAIKSIDYTIETEHIYLNELINIPSEKEESPDAIDIANVIITEIEQTGLEDDYKLLEAIAYLEEYQLLKKDER